MAKRLLVLGLIKIDIVRYRSLPHFLLFYYSNLWSYVVWLRHEVIFRKIDNSGLNLTMKNGIIQFINVIVPKYRLLKG